VNLASQIQSSEGFLGHPIAKVCAVQDPHIPQVPFEEKLHAIAYVNSNCMAESGRSDLMRALIKLGHKAKVRPTVLQVVFWVSHKPMGCCKVLPTIVHSVEAGRSGPLRALGEPSTNDPPIPLLGEQAKVLVGLGCAQSIDAPQYLSSG
jgi:hypothetical protein